MRTLMLAILAGAVLSAISAPARAGCHLVDCVENVDITPADLKSTSCEQLWILRNSIFKEQGYCFKSEKARAWFNNAGCRYDDIRLVPLNDYQRKNIDVIRDVEAKKRCEGAE